MIKEFKVLYDHCCITVFRIHVYFRSAGIGYDGGNFTEILNRLEETK